MYGKQQQLKRDDFALDLFQIRSNYNKYDSSCFIFLT